MRAASWPWSSCSSALSSCARRPRHWKLPSLPAQQHTLGSPCRESERAACGKAAPRARHPSCQAGRARQCSRLTHGRRVLAVMYRCELSLRAMQRRSRCRSVARTASRVRNRLHLEPRESLGCRPCSAPSHDGPRPFASYSSSLLAAPLEEPATQGEARKVGKAEFVCSHRGGTDRQRVGTATAQARAQDREGQLLGRVDFEPVKDVIEEARGARRRWRKRCERARSCATTTRSPSPGRTRRPGR